MFRVGQKVVCVDDQGTDPHGVLELHKGNIYTIRWIGMYKHPFEPNQLCVRLYEINQRGTVGRSQPVPDRHKDIPFRATRFRPLEERKTDISVFITLLTPKKVTTEKEHVMEPD